MVKQSLLAELYLWLGAVSILTSLAVVVTLLSDKKRRRHPHTLIVWLSLCNIATCLSYCFGAVISGGTFVTNDELDVWYGEDSEVCLITGFVNIAASTASVSWVFVLAVDTYLSLRRPLWDTSPLAKVYHVYTWVISAIVAASVSPAVGRVTDTACFITVGHYRLVWLIPMWLQLFGSFIFLYLSKKILWNVKSTVQMAGLNEPVMKIKPPLARKQRQLQVKHQLGYVAVFCACYLVPSLLRTMQEFNPEVKLRTWHYCINTISLASVGWLASAIFLYSNWAMFSEVVQQGTRAIRKSIHMEGGGEGTTPLLREKVPSSFSTELLHTVMTGIQSCVRSESSTMTVSGDIENPTRNVPRTVPSLIRTAIEMEEGGIPNDFDNPFTTYARGKFPVPGGAVRMKSYAPEIFRSLRQQYDIDNDELIRALDPALLLAQQEAAGGSEGKSGSFLYEAGGQFVVKTMTKSEVKFLIEILPRYFVHNMASLGFSVTADPLPKSRLGRFRSFGSMGSMRGSVSGDAGRERRASSIQRTSSFSRTRAFSSVGGGSSVSSVSAQDLDIRPSRGERKTLVVRFYGCYQIKPPFGSAPVNVVLMNHVFAPFAEYVTERYDLKGSWIRRSSMYFGPQGGSNNSTSPLREALLSENYDETPPGSPNSRSLLGRRRASRLSMGSEGSGVSVASNASRKARLMLDLDLKRKLLLPGPIRATFLQQVSVDAEFLRSEDIVDYSLLLGVVKLSEVPEHIFDQMDMDSLSLSVQSSSLDGDELYLMGIVDILQKFSSKKKIEYQYKSKIKREDRMGLSVIPPTNYAKRFAEKLASIFISPSSSSGVWSDGGISGGGSTSGTPLLRSVVEKKRSLRFAAPPLEPN